MPEQAYNPIQSVNGAVVPCPSKFDWKLSDVSSADAGRTEDGKMHKMRITQKVHLELEWTNLNDADASTILTAFDPEYISVSYYDYKAHGFLTKRFYVGDRSVTSYSRIMGIGTISFNIIEQ
jgi:hypothetical protein